LAHCADTIVPLFFTQGPWRPSGRRSGPFGGDIMAWTTPTLVEICIGLEINGYLPAEF
jgi:coenzyme PQQ precursor peptide PqqA